MNLKSAGDLTGSATIDTVAGKSLGDENFLGKEEAVTLVTTEESGFSDSFGYTVPAYSVVAIRLHRK